MSESRARAVPRNIDRPNRLAEFVCAALAAYYSVMFLTHEVLMALACGGGAWYFMYKVTMDKPEGQIYRLIYRYLRIGGMIPGPRYAKRFEV